MLLCIVNAHARDMCPSVAKPGRSAPAAAPPAGQPAAPYERSCSWGVSHNRRSVPTPRASHHSPLDIPHLPVGRLLANRRYPGTGLTAEQWPCVDPHGKPLARLWVVSLDRSGPLGMGLSAKYTSSRRVSLRSDWYADAYWLVDAYVSFSGEALSDRLRSTEFSIVANNLLDKAYLSAITENAAWLGAPRTVSMTATVSF